MSKSISSRAKWHTYSLSGYTFQAGTDYRATGGVHLHQVARGQHGYYTRIVDSNGRFSSAGAARPINAHEGEARMITALTA
jgi:hypothetical protein